MPEDLIREAINELNHDKERNVKARAREIICDIEYNQERIKMAREELKNLTVQVVKAEDILPNT